MKNLVSFWSRHVNPHLSTLIATIGTFGLAICLTILLGVSWLCQEILEKESFSLDKSFLLNIHQFANPILDNIMVNLTRLGDPEVVVVVVAVSFGWLLWKQKRQEAIMLVLVCLGALILNQGMKLVFSRPRPVLWTRLISETSFSFPSGHALGSLVLYGFLAYILAVQFPKFSGTIYSLAVAIIGLIGLSRLYLGVHWPTDIIAGFSVGFLWLMLCITMLKLQKFKAA